MTITARDIAVTMNEWRQALLRGEPFQLSIASVIAWRAPRPGHEGGIPYEAKRIRLQLGRRMLDMQPPGVRVLAEALQSCGSDDKACLALAASLYQAADHLDPPLAQKPVEGSA